MLRHAGAVPAKVRVEVADGALTLEVRNPLPDGEGRARTRPRRAARPTRAGRAAAGGGRGRKQGPTAPETGGCASSCRRADLRWPDAGQSAPRRRQRTPRTRGPAGGAGGRSRTSRWSAGLPDRAAVIPLNCGGCGRTWSPWTSGVPLMDGIEATRAAAGRWPLHRRSSVVTTFENDEPTTCEALRAGAGGFLLKRARPAEIVHAVRLIAEGESTAVPGLGAPARRRVRRRQREPRAARAPCWSGRG